MAFLNNAGDIIVDAVLTDVGRQKLAQGGTNFQITKFALGDAEIDYRLYNYNDPSGSAFYDLKILQTPIFEPSTYALAGLNSRLITLTDNNLLYLPVMKLNQSTNTQLSPVTVIDADTSAFDLIANDNFASFISSNTSDSLFDGRINIPSNTTSLLASTTTSTAFRSSQLTKRFIKVSQGFDNLLTNISLKNNGTFGNPDLEETQFLIYVNRLFLQVVDKNLESGNIRPLFSTNTFNRSQAADVYRVDAFNNPTFFGDIEQYNDGNTTKLATSLNALGIEQVGKELQFSVKISSILASNPSYYFNTFGSLFAGTVSGKSAITSDNVYVMSTTRRVVGVTYGYSIVIPIKLFYKA